VNDFAVFILTHGRPDNVITLKTLKKCGYTGRLYFIIDNEDKTAPRYVENFGAENVIIFDKKKVADECDEGNNFDERRTILMARNACFEIARKLGITYFLQLDDDYTSFLYRLINCKGLEVKKINGVFASYLSFYMSTNCLAIAFAQGGDFIGGLVNKAKPYASSYRFPRRKVMNSFFCSTERPFKFVAAMNEDVNSYTTLGSRGGLFMNIPVIQLNQIQTQSQSGGITDMYIRFGTYCKAFTTVMMMPSCVKVSMMNTTNARIHHTIKWANCVPCIIPERLKKVDRSSESIQSD